MENLWKCRTCGDSPKFCGNCVFPKNFHNRKSGETTEFHAVKPEVQNNMYKILVATLIDIRFKVG